MVERDLVKRDVDQNSLSQLFYIEAHYDLCIRDDLTLGYVPKEDVSVFQYGNK